MLREPVEIFRQALFISIVRDLKESELGLFVDVDEGDLHLASDATTPIDQGTAVAEGFCDDDIDGQERDETPDIRADEIVDLF